MREACVFEEVQNGLEPCIAANVTFEQIKSALGSGMGKGGFASRRWINVTLVHEYITKVA